MLADTSADSASLVSHKYAHIKFELGEDRLGRRDPDEGRRGGVVSFDEVFNGLDELR